MEDHQSGHGRVHSAAKENKYIRLIKNDLVNIIYFLSEIILYISGGNLRKLRGIFALYKENIFILSKSDKYKFKRVKPTTKFNLICEQASR